ncbi:MAG: glycoside hydrolase family 127 protein [Caldilineaceae bacterium]
MGRISTLLIARIGAAQEPDGHLHRPHHPRKRQGHTDRLQADREALTLVQSACQPRSLQRGHMYEAAVAHYEATASARFWTSRRRMPTWSQVWPDARHDVPGHQEIEIGLVRLYRVTGDERHLRQAKFFLDERARRMTVASYANFENPGYMQDHLPVVEQDEAAATRCAPSTCTQAWPTWVALTGDAAYIAALDRLWENVVRT